MLEPRHYAIRRLTVPISISECAEYAVLYMLMPTLFEPCSYLENNAQKFSHVPKFSHYILIHFAGPTHHFRDRKQFKTFIFCNDVLPPLPDRLSKTARESAEGETAAVAKPLDDR